MPIHSTAMGLVVRETKVGESDRLLTILTDKFGLIQASAKGARNLKNRLFSGTSQFCYSEFTLYAQKNNFYVDEAAVVQNFYGLRNRIEALAAAAYLTEILQYLRPSRPEEVQELLRLALNSLFLLSEGKGEVRQIKAVFELRAVSESGFRPNLLACCRCNTFEDKAGFWFDTNGGKLYCSRCCEYVCHPPDTAMPVVTALRHSVYADLKKVFGFRLAPQAAAQFYALAERYFCTQMDRQPGTLTFLHSVLQPEVDAFEVSWPQKNAAKEDDFQGKEPKIDTQDKESH